MWKYSNHVQDFYEYIEDYNPYKKLKVLIVFDAMIADIISNKKFNQIVTELFVSRSKLNICTGFITESYFAVPKDARLNCTHFLLLKFQTNKSFDKFHLIIHPILTFKTLFICTKTVQQNHILS